MRHSRGMAKKPKAAKAKAKAKKPPEKPYQWRGETYEDEGELHEAIALDLRELIDDQLQGEIATVNGREYSLYVDAEFKIQLALLRDGKRLGVDDYADANRAERRLIAADLPESKGKPIKIVAWS